jgi:hypothetical protein
LSPEHRLLEDLAALSGDPLEFVRYAFPWAEPGTELATSEGPEPWQVDLLSAIRDGLLTPERAIQQAIASGHGIGKSAFVSWLILWGISTFEDTRGVVTANTETQLKTKTWAELAKWYRMFIGRELFKMTATAIFSVDPAHERTWRIDMVRWSEHNPEAFAGLHNQGKRILVVFDEASAIHDVIWETTEGALTDRDTQIIWFVAGNPTKNTGRFRGCFDGPQARFWQTRAIDSRTVSFTNKEQIARWIEAYGEDSDFARVRVKGMFPRAGSMQFISSEIVAEAALREVYVDKYDPLIMGVDVARFGDDSSVIRFRKGRDSRTMASIRLHGVDTQAVAARVAEEYLRYRVDAVFVDGGGVGGGVVDRLRALRVPCFDVQFGAKSDRTDPDEPNSKFANKRAEMYGMMRSWLKNGAIENDDTIKAQFAAVEYGFNQRDEIQLESKADLKRRVGYSPDDADALALTFAYPVAASLGAGGPWAQFEETVKAEYDPLEYLEVA